MRIPFLHRKEKPTIKLYRGFGCRKKAFMMGHLFLTPLVRESHVTNNIFKNALEMIKRYRVRPWKDKLLNVVIGEQVYTVKSRDDGFFSVNFEPVQKASLLKVKVSLVDDPTISATGVIILQEPEKILVSDIDDTIIVSHSTNLLKKLYLLLTKSYEARRPFEGILDFYNKLCEGSMETNMFVYVSSSEWNLYDFIHSFCEFNDFPRGIYMLQDIKTGLRDLLRSGGGTHAHKFEKIKKIMSVYEGAELILIGDSGQRDPYIYSELAHLYPDRIKQIYIRDLKKKHRKTLERIGRQLSEKGVVLQMFG